MSWFWKKSTSPKRRTKPSPQRTTLGVEGLERRDMCAINVQHSGIALIIDATNHASGVAITFSIDKKDLNKAYDDQIVFNVKYANGNTTYGRFDMFIDDGDDTPHKQYAKILFYGSDHDDTVFNNTDLPSLLYGFDGDDELHGGSANDTIKGGWGSDDLFGNDGWDSMFGDGHHGGNDAGSVDYLYGGDDPDTMYGGGGGLNYMYGGEGIDRMYGGWRATNFLFGGIGDDYLFGGDDGAVNFLYGQAGNDKMVGGNGVEFGPTVFNHLIDGEGADQFFGGNRAMNIIDAADGSSYASQKDLIVEGEFLSTDIVFSDANDLLWNPAWGVYPNKPKK